MKKYLILPVVLLLALSCTEQKKEVAVQLYSIRSEIGNAEKYAANHEAVFSALAEMGYTAVEAANYNDGLFYGCTPEQFKADVEAAGMQVLSSHCGHGLSAEECESGDFSESLKWWDGCIAAHKAAGMKYLIVPWLGVPETLDVLQTYCDYFNAVGKKCAENGIAFGYHNHAHEFNKVEGEVMLDYMIQHTDPAYVFFQMDVYWTVMGKAAPVEYFEKYPGRFKVLHVKDHLDVGKSGMVGFDAIFSNVDVAGAVDFVVEQEAFVDNDWKAGMKASIDYLKNSPYFNN
ncbi:MAG: sugar phosphate isomerase/epimerase [Clostridium sp.]|nr:sugar phosphate isomerase/epimerase [Bacteroides sp.]MCM1197764.1 sugar phosphate isomerase/epimerase [Clostridium sp.]